MAQRFNSVIADEIINPQGIMQQQCPLNLEMKALKHRHLDRILCEPARKNHA